MLVGLLFVGVPAIAKQYWLAPSGNDASSGLTLETAWGSPAKVFNTATAGDTVWVKGGTYTLSETVKAKNQGSANHPVSIFAVRGELPVFDCSSFRNWGSEDSKYRGMDLRQAYWHVRGIKIFQAGHNGIIVAGPNIIVEGCIIEECGHDGISIGSGSVNALILNCDSYRNAEIKGKGENGDGFAAKEGVGTIFRGCRAWENCDDGWDVYGGSHPVLLDSCWAFSNGHNLWPDRLPQFQGDGNGFKLGGGGGITGNAPNVVLNSFAFSNVSKGFDQNHNAYGITCINCTGYNNRGMGNFAFHEVPSQGKHVMINNLSYGGTGQNIAAGSSQTTNSWNLGLTFTDEMFESLTMEHAILPRDENYELTDPRITALFALKANNPAIDRGTIQNYLPMKPYTALPYCGELPDLGAREFVSGEWFFPEPAEQKPEEEENQPGAGDRPQGELNTVITQATQFVVNSETTSQVWGPFAVAIGKEAKFDMQSTGNSNGTIAVEFSKDGVSWNQVGSAAKNGSTSMVNNKLIDLTDDKAPWGDEVWVRLKNGSNRNVTVRNLSIALFTYDPLTTSTPEVTTGAVVRTDYFTLSGLQLSQPQPGILIRRRWFESGDCKVDKVQFP